MLYLLTAIAAMTLIMLTLKFFSVKGIYTPQAIMVNYGCALGIALASSHGAIATATASEILHTHWWYLALITGLLYFGSMNVMAVSTRRTGVSLTTMASRTSVILPIIWAAAFLGNSITGWEIVGILLVLLAFTLIIYRPEAETRQADRKGIKDILLPISVFLSVGFIGVCMKTSQHIIKSDGTYATDYPVFETMLFAAAFVGSIIYYAASEGKRAFRIEWKSIAGGLCLGMFNHFVTFGTMHGLKYLSPSTFYGIYNIGTVLLTTIIGITVFGEHLDQRKITGICCAVAAICVLGFLGESL